jgi:hypothetical protein
VNGPLVALTLQPDDPDAPPSRPFSDEELLIFGAFVTVVAAVFAFDMMRTWWESNEWRRDARRRRREQR